MRTSRLLPVTILAALLLPAAAAPAAPTVSGVFDLPGVTTNGQLTPAADGNVWVALEQTVGRVRPDGTTTQFATGDLGNALGFPSGGITSAGGFVWVSQPPASKDPIVKIPTANPAAATGVPVTGLTAGATALTTGPDGNIWAAISDKIVKFPPANPAAATTYTVTGLLPKAIAPSTDGTLWVTDTGSGGRLLNVTTAGAVTPYTVGGQPQFLTGGPGGQIAFGNPVNTPQQIGRLAPGGPPRTIDRPNGSDPFGVAFGADGAYWIAEFAGNRLARLTTDGQLTTLGGIPLVAGRGPRQLTAAPGNTLWVTLDKPGDPAGSKIARVTGVDPPPAPVPAGGGPAGGGGSSSTPTDATTPAVTGAGLSRSAFTAGTKGVVFRFTLSEPATAKLVLSRRTAGRRRGTACVTPTPRLRRAKRCTRLVTVRTTSRAVGAGTATIPLSTRGLRAGEYRAVLTVTDAAGNAAAPITRTFRIVRKTRPR